MTRADRLEPRRPERVGEGHAGHRNRRRRVVRRLGRGLGHPEGTAQGRRKCADNDRSSHHRVLPPRPVQPGRRVNLLQKWWRRRVPPKGPVLRWNDCGRTRIERPRRSRNPSAGAARDELVTLARRSARAGPGIVRRPSVVGRLLHGRRPLLMASRSACGRLHVGCVLVSGGEHRNRIVAAGYNGFLPGTPHQSRLRDGHEQATVHAEQNAIADAARRGVSVAGSTAYISHFPCIELREGPGGRRRAAHQVPLRLQQRSARARPAGRRGRDDRQVLRSTIRESARPDPPGGRLDSRPRPGGRHAFEVA